MVLLLDLDDPDHEQTAIHPSLPPNLNLAFNLEALAISQRSMPAMKEPEQSHQSTKEKGEEEEEEIEPSSNPNQSVALSAAVNCYPVISQITLSIDLNTLHSLSLTCRQIRANMLQYRHRLVRQTLRCHRDVAGSSKDRAEISPQGPSVHSSTEHALHRNGSIRTCARDWVDECRRCGEVTCRNCTGKSPSSVESILRRRFLCSACTTCPLLKLTSKSPCTCLMSFYFCRSCSQRLPAIDGSYNQLLSWRQSYRALGRWVADDGGNGRGTCWQKDRCLAVQEKVVEVEVTEEEPGGYWRQEVEGIGGIVKAKGWRRVKVGRPLEDSVVRSTTERTWCGWCDRVILGSSDARNRRDGAD